MKVILKRFLSRRELAKCMKMLTVVIPTVKRNWENLNIYIMYIIICSESFLE